MLDEIVLAERLGFGECWLAEHHFTDYSILPSPNLIIATALARTTRMRFGNYVNVMPFHHPLRLAAEAAMLDNLARGRFDFGIGKGVRPGEFAKLGLQFDDATAMTDEAIEIVLKAWTEEACTHEGRFWRFPELSLRPRPFQRPHPPLHMVASRPPSAARVGARGWPVAMHFTPTDVVARCVEEYRAAGAARTEAVGAGPYRARPPLCRETDRAHTPAAARAAGGWAGGAKRGAGRGVRGGAGTDPPGARGGPLVELFAGRTGPRQALARGLRFSGERRHVDRGQRAIAYDHPPADHHVSHGA